MKIELPDICLIMKGGRAWFVAPVSSLLSIRDKRGNWNNVPTDKREIDYCRFAGSVEIQWAVAQMDAKFHVET